MRCLISLLLSALVSGLCFAESAEDERAYELYYQSQLKEAIESIPKVVEQYASSLGCNFDMKSENVVPYTLNKRSIYVAVFFLDVGCSGGSAMGGSYIVALEKSSSYPKFYISPNFSSLSQTSGDFPRFIDKLFLKNGELWYSALRLQPQDPLCCPSGQESGRVIFENGIWRGTLEGVAPNKSFKADK